MPISNIIGPRAKGQEGPGAKRGSVPRPAARGARSARPRGPISKGPPKKKIGDPRGGWVGGSKYEKGLGSDLFFRYFFCRVFELPSSRSAQKRDQKGEAREIAGRNKFREKVGFGFLVEFFVKTFRHDFFCKTFFVVFLNSHR
jgi:hypothetical protein